MKKTTTTGELLKSVAGSLKKKEIQLCSFSDPDIGSIIKRRISTAIPSLDASIGGGIPCGRLTEIFGEPGQGKSSLVASIIAETQRQGGIAVMIDSEQAFEPARAAAIGVDIDNLLYSDEQTVEGVFEVMLTIAEDLRDIEQPVAIIWDSIGATTTVKEMESEMTDRNYGGVSIPLNIGCRKMLKMINPNMALIFVNQVRTKMGGTGYGPQTQTPGGYATKFFSSLRIDVRSAGNIEKDGAIIGIKCKTKAVKNKTFPPFKSVEYELFFTGELDDSSFLLQKLIDADLIDQSGAWYQYKEGKKFMKKDFKQFLAALENEEREELLRVALSRI